ncbi:mitochondrial protein C2orf69 homolog isoform X2 [Rhineura floridana]|uniref:mitochondrial protein C2orf69 homolog isoform X2 n=1 Tax=Rhineura floridana TaxID=261503 RepID=UPI002AC86B72|nr:mitochondrial protein C2orf69 homolog isoform X2 [Rhineura floridana]
MTYYCFCHPLALCWSRLSIMSSISLGTCRYEKWDGCIWGGSSQHVIWKHEQHFTNTIPTIQQLCMLKQTVISYALLISKNYREIMVCHPENFQWEQWCLENIAAILGRHFPESYIWVIKCSRMHLHKFSCYDNFVASNMFGAPEHSTDFGAFRHLHALLVNAFKLAQNILLSQKSMSEFSKDAETVACQSPTVATTNGCPTIERERVCKYLNSSTMNFVEPSVIGEVSFTLIGFSKGCVVLNQLLHELKEAKNDKDTDAFIKNIKAIYWLDGGHSGGSNTWVTYPDVLKDFSETGISVNAHVTPYQVFDTMRAWIGKEHKRFVQILEELGVNVNNQLHFADEAPSLDNHFRVHEVF